jgi:hypothetical protein
VSPVITPARVKGGMKKLNSKKIIWSVVMDRRHFWNTWMRSGPFGRPSMGTNGADSTNERIHMDEWVVIGPIAAAFAGLFTWVLKHTVDNERHAKKSDVVFRDVCEQTQKRFEDHFKNIIERIDDFKENSKQSFAHLEKLINGKD